MDRYRGRVAIVTGASSGIGAAIAKAFLEHGLIVVGLARRVDRMKELAAGIPEAKLYPIQCDVSKEEDILSAFKWVEDNLGGADILINNSGVHSESKLSEAETSEWRKVLEVNVLGLSICTREAMKSFRRRNVDDGYIIHIGSVVAYRTAGEHSAMYFASKHAVRELTEGLRRELASSGTNIRVSAISPGPTATEILDNNKVVTRQFMFEENPTLLSEDIADAAVYLLSRPLRVQIHDIIVYPTRNHV